MLCADSETKWQSTLSLLAEEVGPTNMVCDITYGLEANPLAYTRVMLSMKPQAHKH